MFNFLNKFNLKINNLLIWFLFFFNFQLTFILNLFLIFWFFLIFFFIFIKKNESFFFNYNLINLNYYFSLIVNRWFFNFIFYNLNCFWNTISINNLFNKSSNYFLFKWNPLIKQYSYYGYFKSNISHWNYTKTDELKKFKF